jgi:hypothetical protein
MNLLVLYRVDRRDFRPGDDIPPAGDHLPRMKGAFVEAEKLLRSASPTMKEQRANGIYAFEQYRAACINYLGTRDGKLYEIEVNPDDVLHKADMKIVNDIAASANDASQQTLLVNAYLNGETRNSDWVELIVSKATARRMLYGPREKLEVKRQIELMPPKPTVNAPAAPITDPQAPQHGPSGG